MSESNMQNTHSPYTPTTEEVRVAFSAYMEDDAGGWFKAEAGFDRWLAEVKAQAWEEGYEGVTITTVANPYRQEEE